MMEAIDQLREEHRVIETAVPQIQALDLTFQGAEQVMEFLEVFMDKTHHAKEEQHLFRVLAARGVPKQEGLILELLQEHGVVRRYLRELRGLLHLARTEEEGEASQLFDATQRDLVALLQEHLRKEDEQLWPRAEEVLTEEDNAALLAGFAQVEEGQLGEQQYRKYLAWSRLWAA